MQLLNRTLLCLLAPFGISLNAIKIISGLAISFSNGAQHLAHSSCSVTPIIDLKALMNALGLNSVEELRIAHSEWIEEPLQGDIHTREEIWSQSVAVRGAEFAQKTQVVLGLRGRKQNIAENDAVCVLRKAEESYGPVFGAKNEAIASKAHFHGVFIV